MKRLSWRIIIRVVIGIAVLGATALVTRQVQGSIARSKQSVRQILLWQADLAGLTSPLPAMPTTAGTNIVFRGYSKQLKANLNKLAEIDRPKPVESPAAWWGGEGSYNAIVSGKEFGQAFDQAQAANQDLRKELQHEQAVIEALRHLLDYPAAADLASDDPTVLTPHAQQAVDGLNAAVLAIGKLQTGDDPTLTGVSTQISQAVGEYKGLLAAMGTPGQAAAKARAISAVQSAQQAIIANRAAYTVATNHRLSAKCAQAAGALAPYTKQLAQIQFNQ